MLINVNILLKGIRMATKKKDVKKKSTSKPKKISWQRACVACGKSTIDPDNWLTCSDECTLQVLMELSCGDLFLLFSAQIERTNKLIKSIKRAKDKDDINKHISSYYEDLNFAKKYISAMTQEELIEEEPVPDDIPF
jgi:hypothetical protein